jgi:hypothetical protein
MLHNFTKKGNMYFIDALTKRRQSMLKELVLIKYIGIIQMWTLISNLQSVKTNS